MLDLLATLGSALGLDARLFGSLGTVSWWSAWGIALLAGMSSMLGHVAILMLNRIRGLHVVSSLVLRRWLPAEGLLLVALLAVAPLTLSFITALPHVGLGIGRVLEGWSYVILWFGTSKVFGLGWATSLAVTLAGWIVMQALSRLLTRPLGWLLSRLWTLATGRPTMVTSRDILAGTPFMPVERGRQRA